VEAPTATAGRWGVLHAGIGRDADAGPGVLYRETRSGGAGPCWQSLDRRGSRVGRRSKGNPKGEREHGATRLRAGGPDENLHA
jgi:hypothetical protein